MKQICLKQLLYQLSAKYLDSAPSVVGGLVLTWLACCSPHSAYSPGQVWNGKAPLDQALSQIGTLMVYLWKNTDFCYLILMQLMCMFEILEII